MPRGLIRRLLGALPSESPLTLVDVGALGGLEAEWSRLIGRRDQGFSDAAAVRGNGG